MMISIPRLSFTITVALVAGCSDRPADSGDTDSTHSSTDSGDGDGDGDPTGDGDGDGDGDADGDKLYLEIAFHLDGGLSPVSIAVLDVTHPGAPVISGTILQAGETISPPAYSPDGSWAAYAVGWNSEDRLYVHDYARDPFGPAVEVEGLPIGGLRAHFAGDNSGMAVVASEDSAPAPHQVFYVPLSEEGPGVPTLVHEVDGSVDVALSDDGQMLFVAAGPEGEPRQLYVSEVGSGTPSALVQITALPAGDANAYAPDNFAGDVALFRIEDTSLQRQLMRLSLADWPSFQLDPVSPNSLASETWQVSEDGSRVLHGYGGGDGLPYSVELITIEGDVIGAPLAIDVEAIADLRLSPSGRWASFRAESDTPGAYELLISDLDGANPETPLSLTTAAIRHQLVDRWIIWSDVGGTLMAANLDDGIGPTMVLTNSSSAFEFLHFVDERLYYSGVGSNYWSVDFSGDVPGAPVWANHPIPEGQMLMYGELLPSPMDDRLFYRTMDLIDGYTEWLWMNDPDDGAGDVLEIVEWDDMMDARLVAPGWGVVRSPI